MPEPFRPSMHFTPRRGWINDPNGLVYFNGEWHLFYQYFEPSEAPLLQWGHAVSRDLLHWEHLPPAIPPDRFGAIWSGSAVVDLHDSSGLFGGRPGIVCLFTYFDPADNRQCQGLAFSPDGRTFTTYAGNPVIPQLRHLPGQPDDKDFRDPKVFWHAPTARWVMVVAGGILRVFTSTDLLHWRFENASPDITTECPDLFELPVEGEPARRRWVLSGGGRWYMLGQFDGTRFMPETGRLPMAQGPDCYATQTWSDAPAGRRVAIAWLFSWRYQCGVRPGRIENTFPTTPWAGGCLTVPYELTLRATPDGDRLMQRPVPELTAPRQTIPQREPLTLNPGAQEVLPTLDSGALDLEVDLEAASGGALVLHLPSAQGGTVTLTIAPAERRLTLDRRLAGLTGVKAFADSYEAPLPLQADGGVTLRLLIDRSSIEVFAGEGALQFSAVILPDPTQAPFLTAQAGPCRLRRLVAHTLK